MNKKSKIYIAPGVLQVLDSNFNLFKTKLNIKTLIKILDLSKLKKMNDKLYCIEQFDLSSENKQDSIALIKAKKENIYKKGFDYLLVDFTKLIIELDYVRMGRIAIPKPNELPVIIDEINKWYKNEPWEIIFSDNYQVFIESNQKFDIKSFPTKYVVNKSLQHFLPKSKKENYWIKIINEMQMILFQHSIGAESIWFWGEQTLVNLNQNFDEIFIFPHAEEALLTQDGAKWIKAVNDLNKILEQQKSQYQKIVLILDYTNSYHYQNSFSNKLRSVFSDYNPQNWLFKNEE